LFLKKQKTKRRTGKKRKEKKQRKIKERDSERNLRYLPYFKWCGIVAYLLKARTVKPTETAVVREQLCKHARC
jgi:hypothetical protein